MDSHMKKVFWKIFAIAAMALVLAEWQIVISPAQADAVVKTISISLSESGTINLEIGKTIKLIATLTPANSTQSVTWTSSKPQVATVVEGQVTAVSAGIATINARSGSKTAKAKIKVIDPNLPSSVSLNTKKTIRLAVGSQLTLTPTLIPATAKSTYTWKSTKKKVASVRDGVVIAKKVGTARITVTTYNKKKASVKVKVYDPSRPTSVSLNMKGTQTLSVGDVLQLTATLRPNTARSNLKWKSSNKKVARVGANGKVTALKPGKATITVSTRNKKKTRVKIKVVNGATQSATISVKNKQTATKAGNNKKTKSKGNTTNATLSINGIQGMTIVEDTPGEEIIPTGYQPIIPPAGYNLPYVIYACKDSHTIAVIARDEYGNWTRVLRLFPTGMGRNNVTDVGEFTIVKKERWHEWNSGYSPYTNKLSVGIFIHGPIYIEKNQCTIRPSYYNVIGTDCSSGCLRTTCACASWVYYNCPLGTYVIIAQDSRYSTKPPAKIKKSATSDPTDPGTNHEILITDFNVSPGLMMLSRGMSQPATPVNINPSNSSTKQFIFTTSDPSVAIVSSNGLVTAVGYGSCLVFVTAADDYKCTVPVTVVVNNSMMYEAEMDGEAVPDEAVEAVGLEDQADDYDAFIIEETPVEEENLFVADIDDDQGASDEEVCDSGETPDEASIPEEVPPAEENGDAEGNVFMNVNIPEAEKNQDG